MMEYNNIKSTGLPGGPNEVFEYITGVFSTEGYKRNSPDINNPFNVISSNHITMMEDDGTPLRKGPMIGMDNLGNRKLMMPGNEYKFHPEASSVIEVPVSERGLIDKWGFLDIGKENSDVVVGGGLNFPTGTGVNVAAILPRNYDPVFKGVGSFGINQQINPNLNLGVKFDKTFLDVGTKLPLHSNIQPSVTAKYRIPLNKKEYSGKLLEHGGDIGTPENMTPEEYNAWVNAGNQMVPNAALEKEWEDYGDGKITKINKIWGPCNWEGCTLTGPGHSTLLDTTSYKDIPNPGILRTLKATKLPTEEPNRDLAKFVNPIGIRKRYNAKENRWISAEVPKNTQSYKNTQEREAWAKQNKTFPSPQKFEPFSQGGEQESYIMGLRKEYNAWAQQGGQLSMMPYGGVPNETLPPTHVSGTNTYTVSSESKPRLFGDRERVREDYSSTGVQTNEDGSRAEYNISDVTKPNLFGKPKSKYTDEYIWYDAQGNITGKSKTRRGKERGWGINPETGKKERWREGGDLPKAQPGKETKREGYLPWIQDYLFTESDLEFLNDSSKGYCPDGECLERAFKAQDLLFGGKRGFPTSFEVKDANDMNSASAYYTPNAKTMYKYYEDHDIKWEDDDGNVEYYERPKEKGITTEGLYKTEDDGESFTLVSDATRKWFDNNPEFDLEKNDFATDSWDVHGKIVNAGGTNLFTRGVNITGEDEDGWRTFNTRSLADYSESELKELYSKIPVGTIIGFDAYDENVSYNREHGLTPSGHSTMVVGFDDRGVPVVYDYGRYTPIDKHKLDRYGPREGTLEPFHAITNISYPASVEGKTKKWLEDKGMFDKYPSDLNLNEDALKDIFVKGDSKQLKPFHSALKTYKRELMNELNISNADYDMMSGILLAQTMQESSGGKGLENKIMNAFASKPASVVFAQFPFPQENASEIGKNLILSAGDTQGLTQLNINNILNDKKLRIVAKKYGITEEADLFDPEKSAIASIIYGSRNLSTGRNNYKKGRGKKGLRTFKPRRDVRETLGMDVNITYNGKIFKTDEGPVIDFTSKKGGKGSGVTWSRDIKDIQADFDKMTDVDGKSLKGKYTIREEDGEYVVDKITSGNAELTDEEIFMYNWQSPTALTTGDAQGNSQYTKNVNELYEKLTHKKSDQEIKEEEERIRRITEGNNRRLKERVENPYTIQELEPLPSETTQQVGNPTYDTIPIAFPRFNLPKSPVQSFEKRMENAGYIKPTPKFPTPLRERKKGGEKVSNIDLNIYKAFFNEEIKGSKAQKIYDKLNRIYYETAKKKKMSSPNYILTHVITS